MSFITFISFNRLSNRVDFIKAANKYRLKNTSDKMGYKLLIDQEFVPKRGFGKTYKGWIISGELYELMLKIKNLGEKFPGGEFASIEVDVGLQWVSALKMCLRTEQLPKIPEIVPNGEATFKIPEISLMADGMSELRIKIKTVDNQPIQYYETETHPLTEDYHVHRFFASKREEMATLHVLHDILNVLKKG